MCDVKAMLYDFTRRMNSYVNIFMFRVKYDLKK